MLLRLLRCKKGAALLEYSLLAAGVALVSAAGVAIFGHKTNAMISAVAAIMPGAHADDNAPIFSGKIIETGLNAAGGLAVNVSDPAGVLANNGTPRLENNLGITGLDGGLILE